MGRQGEEPPLSVPPAPALRSVVKMEGAQSPLSRDELNDLMDYGNERMKCSACSLDPFRREVRVSALTDEQVLLMTSCEAGAYNTIWLACWFRASGHILLTRYDSRCPSSHPAMRRVTSSW